MIIWLCFLLLLLCILFFSSISKDKKDRALWLFVFVCILSFFSAFRDALGTDYENYLEKLSYSSISTISILSEPLFEVISCVIQKTALSPVFFFFILIVKPYTDL